MGSISHSASEPTATRVTFGDGYGASHAYTRSVLGAGRVTLKLLVLLVLLELLHLVRVASLQLDAVAGPVTNKRPSRPKVSPARLLAGQLLPPPPRLEFIKLASVASLPLSGIQGSVKPWKLLVPHVWTKSGTTVTGHGVEEQCLS